MRLLPSLAIIGSLQYGLGGPFDCHTYALRGMKGAVLVDCGAGTHTEELLKNLGAEFGEVEVAAALITHAHADHCGGAAEIRARTGCQIAAPEPSLSILEHGDEEASGLRAAKLQGSYPQEIRLAPCPVDKSVRDAETFEAGGLKFRAIHVRGHSRDSFCYFTEIDGRRVLFSGDVVFYGGILGVINVDGSGMDGYRQDLQKLSELNIEGFFPGHGLFALRGGQRHIDQAVAQAGKGFMPRQIGQGDLIF